MRSLVIDASAAGAWILPDEASPAGEQLLRDITRCEVRVAVPPLWWYECANLVRTAVRRGRLAEADARLAVAALRRLPVTVLPWAGEGAMEVLDLALDHGLSAYDAAYVHAAQMEACELYTLDRDLLGLQPQFPWIRSLQDYRSAVAAGGSVVGTPVRRTRSRPPGRQPGP